SDTPPNGNGNTAGSSPPTAPTAGATAGATGPVTPHAGAAAPDAPAPAVPAPDAPAAAPAAPNTTTQAPPAASNTTTQAPPAAPANPVVSGGGPSPGNTNRNAAGRGQVPATLRGPVNVIVAGGVLATEAVGSNRVPDLATGREPHRAQVHNT
ncbi:hypothetical protein EMMF5_005758, partial [Cystobasidiomycetes sp. EMM_F5]